jgi:Kef-type K+ transport system membrane component KefB
MTRCPRSFWIFITGATNSPSRISRSTSVAVVYAVMIETGFNKTELGKIILAACFVTDLGTVLALGIVFARFDQWMLLFGSVTAAVLAVLPRFAPWLFQHAGPAS